jgi:hypothetical protein
VYFSFITPWNSMVNHAVITGLYNIFLWFLKLLWLPYTNTTSPCAVMYTDLSSGELTSYTCLNSLCFL